MARGRPGRARNAPVRLPAGPGRLPDDRGLASGWRRLGPDDLRTVSALLPARLGLGLRLSHRRIVVAGSSLPGGGRRVPLGPAPGRRRAALRPGPVLRRGFRRRGPPVEPRPGPNRRPRLRDRRRRVAARPPVHGLSVEHSRHGARPESLVDAGGRGDRALRPHHPGRAGLRRAGDAGHRLAPAQPFRAERRRRDRAGRHGPLRRRAPRSARSGGGRRSPAPRSAQPAAGRQVQGPRTGPTSSTATSS